MLGLGARQNGRGMPADRLRLVVGGSKDEATGLRPGDKIRRGTLSEPPLKASDSIVERRLAEEIAYARRLLVAMGDNLSNDPAVIARHSGTLQGFDVVAQMLGHIGSVVGAADRDAAVERIGMADLRGRIARRSLAEETLVPLT